jgi:hypothetical protein
VKTIDHITETRHAGRRTGVEREEKEVDWKMRIYSHHQSSDQPCEASLRIGKRGERSGECGLIRLSRGDLFSFCQSTSFSSQVLAARSLADEPNVAKRNNQREGIGEDKSVTMTG